jgi:plastocyanin
MERGHHRPGISRIILTTAVIVIIVVAGMTIYLVSSPNNNRSATTTTGPPGTTLFSSSSASGQSSLSISLSPNIPLISPGEIQNYSAIQFQTVGSPLAGNLSIKFFPPPGISFSLVSGGSVSLAADPQALGLGVTAGSGLSPGDYNFAVETSSATLPARNQTFTIEIVPLLILMDYPTFTPQNATVTKGTTVTWINLNSNIGCCDPGLHDVRFLTGANVTSPLLSRLQTWNYTFGSDGSYEYFCTIHPVMQGDITVTG